MTGRSWPGMARGVTNLRIGLRALLRRPLRTLLVLQGVIWGVAVAIIPPAVLEGSHRAAENRATEMGTDRITIRAQPATATRLTVEDLEAVRKRFSPVLVAAGGYRSRLATVDPGTSRKLERLDLIGATGDLLEARGQRIGHGRSLTPEEIRDGAPVAVLEPEAARALFDGEDPLGRELTIGPEPGRKVRVVGVAAARSETATSTDDFGLDLRHPFAEWMNDGLTFMGVVPVRDRWKRAERGVVVPLAFADPEEPARIDWLILRTGPRRAPPESIEVERFLVERSRDVEVRINLVWPMLVGNRIDRYLSLNRALFLACLVMGGVVIANIMLLSVLERRREIAIRRSEGATRSDIVLQFLTEALLMGLVGTAIGVPLGIGLARLRVALEPVSMLVIVVPWGAVAVTSAIAVSVTVIAGILPAIRAARLDPVEALRWE